MLESLSPPLIVASATLAGLAAAAATPWVRAVVAGPPSRWLGIGLHPVVAAAGAGAAAAFARSWAELAAFVLLATAGSVLLVLDLAVHRLPDVVVGPTAVGTLGLLAVAAATGAGWAPFWRSVAAGSVLLVGYLGLALATPSGLGLGDVKLAGLLGIALGWLGWPHVLIGTFAAFMLGGLVATTLLAARRVRRDSAVAFGPSMLAGAVLGALWGPAVVGAV